MPKIALVFSFLFFASVAPAQTARQLLTAAQEQIAVKGYKDAEATLTQAIAKDPNLLDAYFERGKLYATELRKPEKAHKDLTHLQMKFYRQQEVCFYSGKAYMLQHNYDQAEKQYTLGLMALIQSGMNRNEIYFARGIAYYTNQKFDLALSDFNTVVSAYPKSWNGWYYRGLAKKELGQLPEAEKDLDVAVTLSTGTPSESLALTGRGDVRDARGNANGACADYIKSAELGYFIASNKSINCPGSKRYHERNEEEIWRNSGSVFKGADLCTDFQKIILESHNSFHNYKGTPKKVILEGVQDYESSYTPPKAVKTILQDSKYNGSVFNVYYMTDSDSWEPAKASWDDLCQMIEKCLIANGHQWTEKKEDYQDKATEGKMTWYLPHPTDTSGWYRIRVIAHYGRGILVKGNMVKFTVINEKQVGK